MHETGMSLFATAKEDFPYFSCLTVVEVAHYKLFRDDLPGLQKPILGHQLRCGVTCRRCLATISTGTTRTWHALFCLISGWNIDRFHQLDI